MGREKSTSFKMMCGLSTPTSGTAKIMGQRHFDKSIKGSLSSWLYGAKSFHFMAI